MRRSFFFTALFILLLTAVQAFAETTVNRVEVVGNRRVPTERVLEYTLKPGDAFDMEAIDQSIHNLIDSRHFIDARVDFTMAGADVVLTYTVKERPFINKIVIEGNDDLEERTIEDALPIKPGDQYDVDRLQRGAEELIRKYEENNLFNAKVSFETVYRENNTVDLFVRIEEGEEAKIYNIIFLGNKAYSREELLESIETEEKGFWTFISSSGQMKREQFEQDKEMIRTKYLTTGYADVKIADPEIVQQEDSHMVDLIFRIDEGEKYYIGKIGFEGMTKRTEQELRDAITLKEGDLFDAMKLQQDAQIVTESFTSIGYAFANVYPDTNVNRETKKLDVTYKIEEGILVDIGRIIILGNEKTRDRVIRREFDIMEGAQYNSKLIRDSNQHVQHTGYFGNVRLSQERVDNDTIDLVLRVEEQPTGMFTLGATYSSVDGLLMSIQLTQQNLFGYGYDLSLKGEFGGDKTNYTLNFTNPYLFDKPITFGVDLYDTRRNDTEYDKHTRGFGLRLGHPIIRRKLSVFYRLAYDYSNIYNVHEDLEDDIEEGDAITVSFRPTLSWTDVDNPLDPSKGSKARFSVKYTGGVLGGDVNIIKSDLETWNFYPLFWKFVGMIHTEIGYVRPHGPSGELIPVYEKYRLGGMYSVRGFENGSISPVNENGEYVGGDKKVQLNVEATWPISVEAKVKGVVFVDAGQVYDTNEVFFERDTRESAGVGFRWYSPVGPLRLEYGYKLDPVDGESKSRWDFSIGGVF